MSLLRRLSPLVLFSAFIASLAAQEPLNGGPKLGGGGDSPLFESFLNQDKSWYQDARQAYHGEDLVGADGPLAKLDWSIAYTQFQHANHVANNPGVPFSPDDEIYPYENGLLLVEITCENGEAWMQVEPAIAALGGTVLSHDGQVINAWIPIGNNGQASLLPGVTFIRPAFRETRVGATTSQGDRAVKADLARDLGTGFSGAGITIGTLSDSFATASSPATTAPQDVESNDLPVGIDVLSEFGQPASDEGRAMMQIIHDLAPGASQKFFTAFNGQADFANGIRALADAGCDIIVDDVFFFAEPFFQNGLIAQAVNEVSAQGKSYFSAAGNSGRKSYESAFRISEGFTGRSRGPLHDFDPGPETDPFMDLTIPVGSAITFVLQWDQPFFSVSGAPGCQSDIDVFLTGSGAGQFNVVSGGFASNQGGDALEIFTFTNQGNIDIDGQPGPDTRFNLVIEGLAGNAPGLMKILFMDRGGFTQNEFDTQSGTLVGHANAQHAIGVAAAPFFETPTFGVNPAQLESFSSPGGTPLLFADDGTRLPEPLDTGQPRFTSADGGNTTFFGQNINDGDNFPNFFGTSAAAPHAAAVAALLLEKAGGSGALTASETEIILSQTALDMGTPGKDVESGTGLIDAVAALSFLDDTGFGDPLLPDVFMDEANQSWLNANVWDNDEAPSPENDYVLAPTDNNVMRSSPENQIGEGNANFTGNSLTITEGTLLIVKQETGEIAQINSGNGDLILAGGLIGFGADALDSSPTFKVRDFRITGNSNPIVDLSPKNRRVTIDGRLTGNGDFSMRLGGSPSASHEHRLTFTNIDEEGFASMMSLERDLILEFLQGSLFKAGAGLSISENGILNVNDLIAFQEGKLSDPVNGIVPPGVYFGPRLTVLGSNYRSENGVLIVSNSLEDTDNDDLLDALEELIINFDENDDITSLTDVTGLTDFDNDGLTDAEELTALTSDPTEADSDNDGANDLEEQQAGTDPFDSESKPIVINPAVSQTPLFENGELIQIEFTITGLDPARAYKLTRSENLVGFPDQIEDLIAGATEATRTETAPPTERAFYRLESGEE